MAKFIASLVLIITIGFSGAQSQHGVVFVDANGNGIRDAKEEGLEGVVVSDQMAVVRTTKNGAYEIKDSKGYGLLFVSLPDGYTSSQWWKKVSPGTSCDFALTPKPAVRSFTFLHASDTHISAKSLDRMQKLREVIASAKPDFVLITGDLIRDALRVGEQEAAEYYSLYVKESAQLGSTVWNVPGNHENFGIERHLSLVSSQHPLYGKKMYRSYLGPNYYSFNYGGVHFVGLDDVDFEDTWYFGHVDSSQAEWLKADLGAIPASMPVVTFQHMPFFSGGLSLTSFTETGPGRTLEREGGVLQFRHVVSNAHEILQILHTRPHPLSLAGHYHARQIYQYESLGQNTRFEQTAAVIGPNGEGGTQFPSGVTVYRVENGVFDKGAFIRLDN